MQDAVQAAPMQPVSTSQPTLTPEMVQQMIIIALSAFGIQGNDQKICSWILDSGASNHMTGKSELLQNIRNYSGPQYIQIANGSLLPIDAVEDIGSSFQNVFVSSGLSTNLISVGQLVENNCNISFSRDGCLVQDHVLGKVIAKGPKVGRLFPLQFSIPRTLSLACSTVNNRSEVWHKRLGHPNSQILRHLFQHGFLGNKDQTYDPKLSIKCVSCKLGKSKTIPFPLNGNHATKCFDTIHSNIWGISPVVSHGNYKNCDVH